MTPRDLKRLEAEGAVRLGRTVGEALSTMDGAGGMPAAPSPGPEQGSVPARVVLSLPWPPSINSYYRYGVLPLRGMAPVIGRGGSIQGGFIKPFLTGDAEAYREVVTAIVAGTFRATGNDTFRCRVRVEVDVHPPNRRKRDLDNLLKCTLDVLTHAGVYADDSLIVKLVVHRRHMVPEGQVVVTVDPLPDQQPALWE